MEHAAANVKIQIGSKRTLMDMLAVPSRIRILVVASRARELINENTETHWPYTSQNIK